MTGRIFYCNKCQSIIRLVQGQHVAECFSCKNMYYTLQEVPPIVVLKPEINQEEAKKLITEEFEHNEVASDFRANATFMGATCYYIPLFEMRVVRADWKTQAFAADAVFSYSSRGHLTLGNDLTDLEISTIDNALLQQALLKATYIRFKPTEIRKTGVVLPFTELKLIKESDSFMDPDIVEKYCRLIYFPVWQVGFRYQGLIFKNYVSAVDGQVISLKAFREHKKKMLYSLLGLLSIAVFMGRGAVEGPVFAILSVAVGIPLLILLAPYFWEMYAFRELVQIQGESVVKQSIGFAEDSFSDTFKLFFKKVLGKGQKRNS